MGSLSCHSEETEEGVLLVYSGEINPIRGVTDDSRMETIAVNQDPSNTFVGPISDHVGPTKVCYLGKSFFLISKNEYKSAVLHKFENRNKDSFGESHFQFQNVAEKILYYAYEIFHLVVENQMLSDIYISIIESRD